MTVGFMKTKNLLCFYIHQPDRGCGKQSQKKTLRPQLRGNCGGGPMANQKKYSAYGEMLEPPPSEKNPPILIRILNAEFRSHSMNKVHAAVLRLGHKTAMLQQKRFHNVTRCMR